MDWHLDTQHGWLWTSAPVLMGIVCLMVLAGGWSLIKPCCWRRLRTLFPMVVWAGYAIRISGALRAFDLVYWIQADPFRDVAIWVVFVSKWAVDGTMYLVWEVYGACLLWYCPFRKLHALKALLLQGSLCVSGVRILWMYFACIECSNWSQVHMLQWSGYLRSLFNHNVSPGLECEFGGFVWIDHTDCCGCWWRLGFAVRFIILWLWARKHGWDGR